VLVLEGQCRPSLGSRPGLLSAGVTIFRGSDGSTGWKPVPRVIGILPMLASLPLAPHQRASVGPHCVRYYERIDGFRS